MDRLSGSRSALAGSTISLSGNELEHKAAMSKAGDMIVMIIRAT